MAMTDFTPVSDNIIDLNNSSTTLLSGAATYTGESTTLQYYRKITVIVITDVSSAVNGLNIQTSDDGTTWTSNTYSVVGGVDYTVSINISTNYYKISYTNGGSPQTTFTLTSYLFTSLSFLTTDGYILSSNNTQHNITSNITCGWDYVNSFNQIVIYTQTSENSFNMYLELSADGSTSAISYLVPFGVSYGSTIALNCSTYDYFRIRITGNTGLPEYTKSYINTYYGLYKTDTDLPDNSLTKTSIFGADANNTTFRYIGADSSGGLKVSVSNSLTPFGHLLMVQHTPIIEIDSIYGLLRNVETYIGGSGAVSGAGGLFTTTTGTTVASYGYIRSKRYVQYTPGRGISFRFTAKFSTPVANSLQIAGALNATNGLCVGYSGTTFGLLRRISGANSIYRLTFTVGTGGNETHTITLNGTIFTVNTVGVLSTDALAETLRASNYGVWTSFASPQSISNTITFILSSPSATAGAFTYSSTGTATASFTQIQVGVANDDVSGFVPATSWNIDKLDGSLTHENPSGILIDPTKLNMFEITMPCMGNGVIILSVMGNNGSFTRCHEMRELQPNSAISRNPVFKIGWVAMSLGSTTNLTVSGTTGYGSIQGLTSSESGEAKCVSVINSTVTTTRNTLLSLTVRSEYFNTTCIREAKISSLSILVEGAGIVIIEIMISPTISGNMLWNYVDSTNSIMLYSTTQNTLTPANICATFIVSQYSNSIIDLEKYNIYASLGNTVVVTAYTRTGSYVVNASLMWK